jgi:multidrug resistance protein MdtO
LQAWAVLADCEATLSRVALEPGWQESEHARLTMRAQTVLAQAREIMLAGDALSLHIASADPRALDAARAVQERAADLERYADDLAADPPAAHRPMRTPSLQQVSAPANALLAAADELSRQVAGLPDWRVDASGAAISTEALRT